MLLCSIIANVYQSNELKLMTENRWILEKALYNFIDTPSSSHLKGMNHLDQWL